MKDYMKRNAHTILLIATFYICTIVVLYNFAEVPQPCEKELDAYDTRTTN